MASGKAKRYRSYLIRCWISGAGSQGGAPAERFVVERVSDEPRRWGFDTFEELIACLRTQLLEPQEGTNAIGPPDEGG